MKFSKIKGPLFVFLSALLFGSYGVWAVLLGQDFEPFYQGYVRAFLVLVVLVPAVIISRTWIKVTREDWKKYAWCMGFGVFTQAPLYYAFQNAGIGISSLIFFSLLLVTSYVVGFSLLREIPTKTKIVSLVLAILGLVFTFSHSLGIFSIVALGLAALNGIASGGEVATTKLIPEKFSALQTSIMVWAAIFVTHLPISFLLKEKQMVPELSIQWLAMLGFTLAGVLGFWLVIEGFKYVDASIGGLIGLLEIVFAIIFGAIVFHEVITVPIIIGATLIITAAVLPNINQKKSLVVISKFE
jgi:drug/metabolite transporter (DMT)-like permease